MKSLDDTSAMCQLFSTIWTKEPMPKIIDRDKYMEDLAARAAGLFSTHGYAGVGMRGVAEHLGMSKSALYHYFPSKEALFLACTKSTMGRMSGTTFDETTSEDAQLQLLVSSMRAEFGAEMALVFDYLRGKSPAQIASDEAMQLSLSAYLKTVEGIVGPERAAKALSDILGRLLLDYLSGQTLNYS
jgi:AcrR family transcriptional regulator